MIKQLFPLSALSLSIVACGGGGGAPSSGSNTAQSSKGGLVGSPAPEFELPKVGGGTLKLASLKGKVVLVDFWGTWCEPCKKSFPKYQELYVKYKDKMEILAIAEEDANEGLDAFGKSHGNVQFPLLWDEGKGVAGKYGVNTMPTAYLIDREGVVRFVHEAFNDGDEAQIERELKELF